LIAISYNKFELQFAGYGNQTVDVSYIREST
jgi:hypothetical protein